MKEQHQGPQYLGISKHVGSLQSSVYIDRGMPVQNINVNNLLYPSKRGPSFLESPILLDASRLLMCGGWRPRSDVFNGFSR